MKLSILFGSAILLATALTPVSAYADDSNLVCRRSSCDSRNGGGNEKLSISGFDINVKSSDRGNRNRNNAVKDTRSNDSIKETADADDAGNEDAGNDNSTDSNGAGNEDAGTDNTDADNNDPGTDNTDAGNVDPGTDNTDTGASNNPPPQSNSNDIKGFDPFGGLYGPGT